MAPTNQQLKSAKTKQISTGKSPKARVQRYLKSTESKIVEDGKSTLLLKGIKCSQSMSTVMKDLRSMLAPSVKVLSKKNEILPFDNDGGGPNSLEFLTTKNDCSIFGLASHNKKRPNNLIFGRTFDRQLLDMIEIGVLRYKSIQDFGGTIPKKRTGSKPLMLFVGDLWLNDSYCIKLQNLLIDLYKGTVVDKIVLSGIDHMIVFTAVPMPNDDIINNPNLNQNNDKHKPYLFHQRTYFIQLKKNPNGSKVPAPHLTNCGPNMDFEMRRTQFASSDLWKAAIKQPKAASALKTKKTTKKNQSTNIFGETIGRLHIEKQNVDNMHGKKAKAIRIASKINADEEKSLLEKELAREKDDINMEFKQAFGFNEEEEQ